MKKAILRTLAYADVFDYPLKKEEIYRFLISSIKYQVSSVSQALKGLPQISQEEGFLFLKGREKIVAVRKKREKESQKKLAIAQRTGRWLRLIPFIKMVAVTGALAMKNSQRKDDVDLLIVTSKNRLWLTRLLTVFLIEIVARRRRPGDKEFANKICLNMFLDKDHLSVPEKEQDLFSAHEVCQMKVLWEKDETYQKFLKENQWVKRFLPNWKP